MGKRKPTLKGRATRLKGPGNTCVGDSGGVVCGGGALDSGGDDSGAGGGIGSGGLGSFIDASGSSLGIATSPNGTGSDPSNPYGYVGGTTNFGSITLAGPSDMPGSTPIQFGAVAMNSDYQNYLKQVATVIGINGVPTTDTQYLAFLTLSAPTLSPYAPLPGVNQPISGKPPNPCSYFPNKSCFPKKPPNPLSLQFLTMENTTMQFWDLWGQ